MSERIDIIDIDMSSVRDEIDKTGQSIDDLSDNLDDVQSNADKTSAKMNNLADSLKNVADAEDFVKNLSDGLGGLADMASGVAGGFAAVEGALNLMGVESEDVTESILKMQSIMAITDGFDAIGRGVKGFYEMYQIVKNSTVAVKALSLAKKADAAITATLTTVMKGYTTSTIAATTATKVLKTTLVTSGIGALVIGLGYAIDGIISKISNLSDKAKEVGNDLKNTGEEFSAMSSNMNLILDIDSKEVSKKTAEINNAFKNGSINLQQQYDQLVTLYKDYQTKLNGYLNAGGLSDEATKKIQKELKTVDTVVNELQKRLDEIIQSNIKLSEESAKRIREMKDSLAEIDDYIDLNTKNEVQLLEKNLLKEKETRINSLKEALQQKLISENDYNIKVEALNSIFAKKLQDKITEIEKQATAAREEEKTKIIEAAQEERQKRIDSVTKEFTQDFENLRSEYNLRIAELEIQGKIKEASDLRLEGLKEEAALIEGVMSKYKELGDEENYIAADSSLKTNKVDQTYAQGDVDVAEMENLTMALDTTQIAIDGIIASAGVINSEWGNVFASLSEGIIKVNTSLKKGETGWKSYKTVIGAALDFGASMLNALAESEDAQTKESFETQKKLQIASTVMQMLNGIMSAWSTAMTLGPILGPIMGGINSAMIATIGGVQIAKIKATQFEGSGGSEDSGSTPAASPAASALQSLGTAVNTTTNVVGASVEGNVSDTRVYVLETDISNAAKKVNVMETESTY